MVSGRLYGMGVRRLGEVCILILAERGGRMFVGGDGSRSAA